MALRKWFVIIQAYMLQMLTRLCGNCGAVWMLWVNGCEAGWCGVVFSHVWCFAWCFTWCFHTQDVITSCFTWCFHLMFHRMLSLHLSYDVSHDIVTFLEVEMLEIGYRHLKTVCLHLTSSWFDHTCFLEQWIQLWINVQSVKESGSKFHL